MPYDDDDYTFDFGCPDLLVDLYEEGEYYEGDE